MFTGSQLKHWILGFTPVEVLDSRGRPIEKEVYALYHHVPKQGREIALQGGVTYAQAGQYLDNGEVVLVATDHHKLRIFQVRDHLLIDVSPSKSFSV